MCIRDRTEIYTQEDIAEAGGGEATFATTDVAVAPGPAGAPDNRTAANSRAGAGGQMLRQS